MLQHPHLDVYHLPSSALDEHHPVWWGNTLAITVETTIVALLLVIYFYVRGNISPWPPPLPHTAGLRNLDPRPALLPGTLNTIVLLASCVPMAWADRMARARLENEVQTEEMPRPPMPEDGGQPAHTASRAFRLFVALSILGALSLALRFVEFQGLRFSWHDNAYASAAWSLLGLHLSYIAMSFLEVVLLAIWVWQRGFTGKFALDTTLAATSWYWTTGVWLLLYFSVYLAPRWLHR